MSAAHSVAFGFLLKIPPKMVYIEEINTKKHHPRDYEVFNQYIDYFIQRPERITEANKPKTAVLLNSIQNSEKTCKTIVRLKKSKDNPNYSNSIITFMGIDEKERKRLSDIKNLSG